MMIINDDVDELHGLVFGKLAKLSSLVIASQTRIQLRCSASSLVTCILQYLQLITVSLAHIPST